MSVEGSGLDGGLRCHPDRSNTSPILNSKDISLKIGAVSVNISGFFSTLLINFHRKEKITHPVEQHPSSDPVRNFC